MVVQKENWWQTSCLNTIARTVYNLPKLEIISTFQKSSTETIYHKNV